MKKFLFFLFAAFFCLGSKSFAQQPIIAAQFLTPVTQSTSIGWPVFSKIELGIKLDPFLNIQNPYDPDEVDLYAELIDAQTNQLVKTVYGFFMFTYSPISQSNQQANPALLPPQEWAWRIRLTVDEIKNYKLVIKLRLGGNPNPNVYPTPFYITGQANPTNHGFLRFPNGHKYAQFTDGAPFFGIGFTIPPYDKNSKAQYDPSGNNFLRCGGNTNDPSDYDYPDNVVLSLNEITGNFAAYGGNFIKYYFAPNSIDIEWCTLGKYNEYQNRAWDMDRVLENLEDKGVYLQLGAWTWEQFKLPRAPKTNGEEDSGEHGYDAPHYSWTDNPYHYASPDPNQTFGHPWQLFINTVNGNPDCAGGPSPHALRYFKRKLRYIIARWGYSPNFASLELITEMDNIKGAWDATICGQAMGEYEEVFVLLADYVKQLSPRMLVTAGMASFGAGGGFFNKPSCDYPDFHSYLTNYINGASAGAYIAEFMKRQYKKPFHSGEAGPASAFWWNSDMDDIDAMCNYNNLLWSSSFSGSFTTAMYFAMSGYIFGKAWGPPFVNVYKKTKPVSVFFQGEDLNSEHYVSIKNRAAGATIDCTNFPTVECEYNMGGYPLPHQIFFTGYDINDDAINAPLMSFQNQSIPAFTPGIITSDDNNIEALALRSERKVLGWVHNKANYFYNLPHHMDLGASASEAKYYLHPVGGGLQLGGAVPPNNDQNDTYVPSITEATMTINGLNCVGTYKVEWYGTRGNGGIIPALTVNNIQPVNGSITVNIPDMGAYDPEFPDICPDYGFKITMVESANWSIASEWKNADLNTDAHQINGTALAISNSNNIFYRGIDGDMHYYYYDEYCWANKRVDVWNAGERIDPTSPIAAGNKVFYRNNIKFLEQLWFDQQTQTWIPYMHVNAPVVHAASDITMEGDKVFYSSFNNFLTILSWNGNSWVANELFNAPPVAAGSDITVQNNKVFYRDQVGNLVQVYLSQQNQWISYIHANAPKIRPGSPIRYENEDVAYIDINDFAVIMPFDQVQQLWIPVEISWGPKVAQGSDIDIEQRKVHYHSLGGDMVQVYWAANISAWVPYSFGVNDVSNDSHIALAPGLIFYKGTDNAMHMIYWSGTTWVPYTHPGTEVGTASSILIDQYGKIFYTDPHVNGGPVALGSNQVHVLWWDNPCVTHPPCTYANYRPGRPADTANSSYKLLQPDESSVLKVYPNPSNDGIYNIVAPANTDLYVRVTNLAGQEILSKSISSTGRIDLGSHANGVYMLSIRADKEVVNFRLILDKK